MKTIKTCLIWGFFLLNFINTASNERVEQYWIVSLDVNQFCQYLQEHPHPFDRVGVKGNRITLHVDIRDLNRLYQSDLKIEIQSSKAISHEVPGAETRAALIDSGGINGAYHSHRETQTFLSNLADRYPDQATFVSIGQSIENREIWGFKISDNAVTDEKEPNLYFMGCHHAREWISVEIPLLFAKYLLENYLTDLRVKALVDSSQIYIIPIVNPDGLEFSIHTYRMWRKNRRYNRNLTWGVDLNRNYGYQWGHDDQGSSPHPKSEVYRGPKPFSEPETVAIRDFLLLHPPSGSISFHNYSQLILIPWGYTTYFPEHYKEMLCMANQMKDLIYTVNHRNYDVGSAATTIYLTNGDCEDWVYGMFEVPGFTIELPQENFARGHFITSEEEILQSFREMLPAMLYFAEYAKDHFTPKVVVEMKNDGKGREN